jgi:hypothetical protein
MILCLRTLVCSASKSQILLLVSYLQYVQRQQVEMGTRKKPSKFSLKTGTGVLRRHLYEHHIDSWVAGCDKLHIPITAKDAQRCVTEY